MEKKFKMLVNMKNRQKKYLNDIHNNGEMTISTFQYFCDLKYYKEKGELVADFYTVYLPLSKGRRSNGFLYTLPASNDKEILDSMLFAKGICNDNITALWDGMNKDLLDERYKSFKEDRK